MKKYFSKIFLFTFFLSSCISKPITSLPTSNVIQTEAVIPTIPVTDTSTPSPALPSTISDNLIIFYKVRDEFNLYSIWVWKQNTLQKILQQKDIYSSILSSDGEWLVFLKRNLGTDNNLPTSEVWLMRTDGSDLQLLLSSDKLNSLSSEGKLLLINDISWIPNRLELLFSTEEITEGPPGSWPLFDLYSLNISGQITQLVEVGQGGRFYFSPNGLHVAISSASNIRIINLETGEQNTLLDFEPVGSACECSIYTPEIFWDIQSDFILTSISPQNLHYLEKYAGEPEQVWKLFVNGQSELIIEFQPLARYNAGIDVSPNFQNLFYFSGSCIDGMGMLYFYNLTSEEEYPHSCVWEIPQWIPDGEHFIYELKGLWYLGDINDKNNSQSIEFINTLNEADVDISNHWVWIDDEYFFLKLKNDKECILNIATLQGIVKEIIRTDINKYCLSNDININFSQ